MPTEDGKTFAELAGLRGMTDKDRKEMLDDIEDIIGALKGRMCTGRGGKDVRTARYYLEKAAKILYNRLGMQDGEKRLKKTNLGKGGWSKNRKGRAMATELQVLYWIENMEQLYVPDSLDRHVKETLEEAKGCLMDAVDRLWDYDYLEL